MSIDQFFKLIHEDDDILVLDKAHGVLVIEDRYDQNIPCLRSVLKNIYRRIFIVHRLDSGTGGLMVFAKNEQAHKKLSIQFESGKVEKEYYALVEGRFDSPVTCMLPISKVNYHGKYKINFKSGRDSITTFYPLEYYKNSTLLKVVPYTGRTHQIRVHLKALKHPLVNDFLYNKKTDDKRLTLQSCKLSFFHPTKNIKLSYCNDTSDYIKSFIF
ncbi:MAG: RluA family pseudouridine synthase [Calditerrivibrio sp.]|nr:RluA family pseudouridine synthase [Calditerrivibrio sp.]MCA1932524.1 RluA family pseudouridine synthase [Calditerrivibrio sp.]MCA1981060.1 RluA family pseudouridine synthase [Calditerrivibrio sp.]